MHEVGIMSEALRMAEETAQATGASQINKIRLRLGALSGIVPEALLFAFEVARVGTMAQTATLEIETVPAAWRCGGCQHEFEYPEHPAECPGCHRPEPKLLRGRELEIASVDIHKPDDPAIQ